ncbi:MAG: hypothetical protein HGA54_07475, partial [Actinobacteria bacterium]|nr:hypothetical protein [Actinomycetota bacterium]
MTEADTLLALQDMDFAILRAKKKLEKIPEQDRIMVIRGKRKEVSKKADQIADLRQNCELEITKFQYEASLLRDKIASMQTQLDETTDYRVVAGLSKDMEGGVKRQERIGFEISNLYDRLEKIEEVEKQVTE